MTDAILVLGTIVLFAGFFAMIGWFDRV